MQNRYIQQSSRRKQVYHVQTKLDEEPTTSELIQQLKEKEKEKDEKK